MGRGEAENVDDKIMTREGQRKMREGKSSVISRTKERKDGEGRETNKKKISGKK